MALTPQKSPNLDPCRPCFQNDPEHCLSVKLPPSHPYNLPMSLRLADDHHLRPVQEEQEVRRREVLINHVYSFQCRHPRPHGVICTRTQTRVGLAVPCGVVA
jgi:hypothetical protein